MPPIAEGLFTVTSSPRNLFADQARATPRFCDFGLEKCSVGSRQAGRRGSHPQMKTSGTCEELLTRPGTRWATVYTVPRKQVAGPRELEAARPPDLFSIRRGPLRNGHGEDCPSGKIVSGVITEAILNRTPLAPSSQSRHSAEGRRIINKALEKGLQKAVQSAYECAGICRGCGGHTGPAERQ